MFRYSIYGLVLQTNRPLPDLVPLREGLPVDVWIDLMREDTPVPCSEIDIVSFTLDKRYRSGAAYYHLCFRGDGQLEFEINADGSHVSVHWTLSVIEEVTSLLLGPVLGCVLRLKGLVCLHSCVLGIREQAIAIVGDKGAGKSTTALALASQGHTILSDDLGVLQHSGQCFLAQPGYPRVRLWPETLQHLCHSTESFARVFSFSEKRYVDLDNGNDTTAWRFQPTPLPLAAIYVLGERKPGSEAPKIASIPPSISVMTLMNHRSVSHLKLSTAKTAQELAELSRVAKRVPIRSVTRSDSLEALPDLCKAIEADLASLTSPSSCFQS